jgi:hyperosmotically inducible periplasmic protein
MKLLNSVLAVALAVGLAVGLAACNRESQPKTSDLSSGPGPGSGATSGKLGKTENVAGDTAITAKIKVELLRAPDVKSTDIAVDTRDGQVTLTGTVPDPQQIEQAAKVAGGVEGVRNVDNKLIVKSPS